MALTQHRPGCYMAVSWCIAQCIY